MVVASLAEETIGKVLPVQLKPLPQVTTLLTAGTTVLPKSALAPAIALRLVQPRT